MSQPRAPLFAGLAILVLVGLLIGYFLLETPASPPPRRVNDVAQDQPAAPRLDPRREIPGGTQDTEPAGQAPGAGDVQPKIVVQPKVVAQVRVTGRTVDADNDGVDSITVTLLPEDEATITGPTAVSDADGNFNFESGLNIGDRYFVACLMEGKAMTATAPFTIEKDKPVEGLVLTIYAKARAYGVVLNGADSKPLEGVSIETTARKDERLQRLGRLLGRLKPSRSDAQGKFELDNLAPGAFVVSAVKEGWTANELNPLTRARQDVELGEYANFELLPFILVQAGIIEGRVLTKEGSKPVAGAVVELGTILGGVFDTKITDAEGKFRFESAPPAIMPDPGQGGPGQGLGGLALRAMAPGFGLGVRNVRVKSGETKSGQDILLDAGCTVTGKVLNHKSAPVAGASVYFNDTDFQRGGELVIGIKLPARSINTVTNESGEFALSSLPPGPLTLAATATGYSNGSVQVTTVVGTPQNVVITLQPQAVIFGRVTNDRGEGIAGAAIAAYEADGPGQLGFIMKSFFGENLPDRGDSMMFPIGVRTGQDGSYRLEGLKAASYVLIANAALYEKHVSGSLECKSGKELEYNISMLAGGIIFGRVYDAANQPMAGVPVTGAQLLGQESLRVKTAYTDRNGNYEMTGLAAGTYKVTRNTGDLAALILPNPASEVSVRNGERVEFDIYDQKPGTARLYGRVTLDGQVYADESLLLLGGNFSGFAANNTRTDADGRFEFRSVPLGTYQIARGGQRGPSLVRIRVRVDKAGDKEVNIDFQTVSITGRVELAGGGVPEGRVRVLASPVSPEGEDTGSPDDNVNDLEMMVVEEAGINEKGEFTIKGLSPGFYRLTARSEKNGMVSKPYLNIKASVKGVVLQLPLTAATLKGTVKGLDEAKPNTPFGLIAAITIEDDKGKPLSLGGFDNAINLGQSKEFTVPGLAEGLFTVTLSIGGYSPVTHKNVKLVAGETTALDFVFTASGSARIKISNDDLTLASAYELQYDIVNSKGETFKKRFTFLDFFNTDGSASQDLGQNAFVIKDLPPETYTITLKLPGYKDVTQSFVVIAGQTTEVAVTFVKP